MNTRLLTDIPPELRVRPQWLNWRYEERGTKRTKVPYNSRTAEKASSTDPRTWSSYEEAVAASGNYDGIGFVLTADDPIVGIDLDHCRIPESGALEPWAEAIVTRMASYCEITPSCAGLRIFALGALPPAGRKRGPIEMYDRARYLTVTGAHLGGTPLTVEERTEALHAVHREVFGAGSAPASTSARPAAPVDLDDISLVVRIKQSKGAKRFSRLWAGNVDGFASRSEADLALCGILAFWTQRRPEQIDRLFRSSALMRSKWDSRRGTETYGQRTISKAIASCDEIYNVGRRRVIRVVVA